MSTPTQDDDGKRECTGCHERKPATQEFFTFREFAAGYGPESRCKACKAARERERKAAALEDPEYRAMLAERQREMRERRGDEYREKQAAHQRAHMKRKRRG